METSESIRTLNINKFMCAGRITADIELKVTPSGVKVASVPIATNRAYTNKQTGQKVEETTFLRLTAFGRTAEIIAEYMVKGQVIFAECRIVNRNWEKDHVKHYDFSFIINEFQFGQKPQWASSSYQPSGKPVNEPVQQDTTAVFDEPDMPIDNGFDDGSGLDVSDIPF